ncbi:MAG: hypothetical protein ACYC3L_07395 [Gemmatimonadaceae bacterium]
MHSEDPLRRSRRQAVLILLGLATLSCSSAAQKDRAKDDEEKTCDKAARILEKGHPEKRSLWAYGTISGCPGAAGVLRTSWADPPSDPDELHSIAAATYEVADSRLVTALLNLVQQTPLPLITRVTVLKLLVSQYNREKVVNFRSGDSTAWVGTIDHTYQVSGEQPVTTADRQRMREVFRSMAASDPQPRIRAAAKAIMREIDYF